MAPSCVFKGMKTDEQLYAEMRSGRRAAFDELYARYERKLFGFILAYLKNEQDAEEVFHDALKALVDAAQNGRQAELPQKVGAWLFTVARNASLNRLRSRRVAVPVAAELADAAAGAVDDLIQRGRQSALTAAVDRLPPALGRVYQLRAEGASYEDMARRLDLPLGTVKSRVNTLVRRLKKEMALWLA